MKPLNLIDNFTHTVVINTPFMQALKIYMDIAHLRPTSRINNKTGMYTFYIVLHEYPEFSEEIYSITLDKTIRSAMEDTADTHNYSYKVVRDNTNETIIETYSLIPKP